MKPGAKHSLFKLGISFFDPEVRRWLNDIAAQAPSNSILRHPLFDRLTSLIKPWLEDQSQSMGPLAGPLLGKLIDYADYTANTLGSKESGPQGAAGKAGQFDWAEQFTKDATKRLRESPDPKAELKKLKMEFRLRLQLADFISKQAAARAAKAKAGEVPPQDDGPSLLQKLVEFKKEYGPYFKDALEDIDDAAEKHVAPVIGRLADWFESHGGKR